MVKVNANNAEVSAQEETYRIHKSLAALTFTVLQAQALVLLAYLIGRGLLFLINLVFPNELVQLMLSVGLVTTLLGINGLYLAAILTNWKREYYIVTPTELIINPGKHERMIAIDTIKLARLSQTTIAKRFNFGDIIVTTFVGTEEFKLESIPDPAKYLKLFDAEAIDVIKPGEHPTKAETKETVSQVEDLAKKAKEKVEVVAEKIEEAVADKKDELIMPKPKEEKSSIDGEVTINLK